MADIVGIVLFVLLVVFRSRASHFQVQCARRLQEARQRRLILFRRRQAQQRFFFAILASVSTYNNVNSIERTVWSRKRSDAWWETIVNRVFTDSDWVENFRMSEGTFNYICQELQAIIAKEDTVMRKAIPVRQRLAIALWRLSTNSDYRTISHLFGVSRSSVCTIVREVCQAIVDILLPKYIQVPRGTLLEAIIDGFESKWGYPQCVGAIDGSHIPIVAPKEFPADYHNRKGWHSIVLQAVVDHECRFWNVNVGWPGQVHDARVLSNSDLFHQAEMGTLLRNRPRVINGVNVPLIILGDHAYPLLPWLMKPFVHHGSITNEQRVYNFRHSRARMVVENTFGRLKGRWRCLIKRNDTSTDDVPLLILACCVLHNVCEVHKEEFNSAWLEDVTEATNVESEDSNSAPQQTTQSPGAAAIRRALCSYINNH